ncbi:hypothetical protein Agub_g13629, partial [Astrephomene gubernaculifera]
MSLTSSTSPSAPHHGVHLSGSPLARHRLQKCPLRPPHPEPLSPAAVGMWPLGSKSKKSSRHWLSWAVPQAAGKPGAGHSPERRGEDDSFVITASALAPALASSAPMAASSSSTTASQSAGLHHFHPHHTHHPHPHHPHPHTHAASAAASLLSGPSDELLSPRPTSLAPRMPYQRLAGSSNAASAAPSSGGAGVVTSQPPVSSLDGNDLALSAAAAAAAARRSALCEGGLPDPDMCG